MTPTNPPAPPASPARRAPRRSQRLALVIGVLALTGGLWLLLGAMGFDLPIGRLWPIFFLLGAAASLVDYWLSRSPFSAAMVTFGLGFGILGFAVTLDFTSLGRILDWLPSFPTIVGLAFLTGWAADGKKNGGLALAGGLFVALGLLGFTARFQWLQDLIPSAQVVWAILLLGGGGFILWRVFRPDR